MYAYFFLEKILSYIPHYGKLQKSCHGNDRRTLTLGNCTRAMTKNRTKFCRNKKKSERKHRDAKNWSDSNNYEMYGMIIKQRRIRAIINKQWTQKNWYKIYNYETRHTTLSHHPRITIKMVGEEYDGHFSNRKNTIQINFKNIMQDIKKNKADNIINFQGEMLDIGLMEMSHGKQDITFKKKRKDFWKFIKLGFDYDEMYDTEGTIEYEAHEILEPQIINEFLEMYTYRIDTTNAEQVEKADYLFDRYTYTNKNPDQTNKQLMFMIWRNDERDLNKMKTRK